MNTLTKRVSAERLFVNHRALARALTPLSRRKAEQEQEYEYEHGQKRNTARDF